MKKKTRTSTRTPLQQWTSRRCWTNKGMLTQIQGSLSSLIVQYRYFSSLETIHLEVMYKYISAILESYDSSTILLKKRKENKL